MLPDRTNVEEDDRNNDYCNLINSDGYDKNDSYKTGRNASSRDISQLCLVCDSKGYINSWRNVECCFCNGTGENTKAAESFMKIHPCQCIDLDRKNCPLCKLKCHHSTNNKPKVLVVKSPPPSSP
jgi:hypothetical protein